MGSNHVRAFDTQRFADHVYLVACSRGLTMRDAGEQAGVSASTLCRAQFSLQSAAALASWANLSLDAYVLPLAEVAP